MNYIILISGKSQVGKDTLADYFVSHLNDNYKSYLIISEKIGFADEIKRVAKENFGWNGIKDEKGVNLLIRIGEIGREYNENIWVDKLLNNSIDINERNHLYIIKDWRFINEYHRINECRSFNTSIYTIRINGISRSKEVFINSEASTENELDNQNQLMDYIIENNENTNLEDFFSQGKLIITDIINKIIKEKN